MINIELIEDIKENENLNHLASEEIWNNEWFEGNDSRDNRSSADRFFNVGIPNNQPNNTNINKKDYNQNNSGNGSSNSGSEKNYNNNSNKDADFSELYKKIRKKMEELKITKKNKIINNIKTTNTYQIWNKNRTGLTAISSLNNYNANLFLSGIIIATSLQFVIRLRRLNTLYRNPFFHLRRRLNDTNNFRTIVPMLKNFGLLPQNYIYDNTRTSAIREIMRIRSEYQNLFRIISYFFGPVLGLFQFWRQHNKKK